MSRLIFKFDLFFGLIFRGLLNFKTWFSVLIGAIPTLINLYSWKNHLTHIGHIIFHYKRRSGALFGDGRSGIIIPLLSIKVKKTLLLWTLLLDLGTNLFTGMLSYSDSPYFLYRNEVMSFNPHATWESHTLFLNWTPGSFFQVTGFFQDVLKFEKLLLLLLGKLEGLRM